MDDSRWTIPSNPMSILVFLFWDYFCSPSWCNEFHYVGCWLSYVVPYLSYFAMSLDDFQERDIPVLIFSAGLADIIEEVSLTGLLCSSHLLQI